MTSSFSIEQRPTTEFVLTSADIAGRLVQDVIDFGLKAINHFTVDGDVVWSSSDTAIATITVDAQDSSIVKVTPVKVSRRPETRAPQRWIYPSSRRSESRRACSRLPAARSMR